MVPTEVWTLLSAQPESTSGNTRLVLVAITLVTSKHSAVSTLSDVLLTTSYHADAVIILLNMTVDNKIMM